MADTSISSQVYISRDQIRNQIISSVNDYLELGNVDLAKSSFLSFIINTISTLTSNLFFYNVSTYREFFLTTAQLPETIYNLSSFLGYTPKGAAYSTAYVLVGFPMGFYDPGSPSATFTLPEGFNFYAGSMLFKTYYRTQITVTNNETVTAKLILDDNREVDLPVYIDTTSNPVVFYITLPTNQTASDKQQLQIRSDLQPYVFTSVDLIFDDQLSSISVAVGSETNIYTQYPSVFLIPTGEKGFVSEKKSFGRRLYFGNGFIGVQPPAGSTVYVNYSTTAGAAGNVITGTITSGDRIYVELTTGEVRVVDYTCTNTSPSSGGVDEESLENIRTNAIQNITSLSRLVSEKDFQNINVIIPNSPFGANSSPILKRSDIRFNEIQLYTTLMYLNNTVPTKNIWYSIDSSVNRIPKYSALFFNSEFYYNVFDLVIDRINNYAYYEYVVEDILLSPVLVSVSDPYYTSIVLQTLGVSNSSGGSIDFTYNYTGTDSTASCYFIIEETGQQYAMTNDSTNHCFRYTFSSYTEYPQGTTTALFTLNKSVYGMPVPVSDYRTNILVTQLLNLSMISNVVQDSTSTDSIIYDIPTIDKNYYDNLVDKKDFEGLCIQPLVLSQYFEGYRMLTDFINLKFADTTGALIGMQLNKTNKRPVKDFVLTQPSNPIVGDRYIVDPESTYNSDMISHRNWYMQCQRIILPGLAQWEYIEPTTNDVILVENKDAQYIFSGTAWIVPQYTIPLSINIEIYKSADYYGSDRDLIQLVKTSLLDKFTSKFGINSIIRRSEVISCVHNVSGVAYCHLIDPKTDIFFNFNLNSFTRIQLLEYSPEYIFFAENTISVKIIASY